jgi:hypothetical protein
MFVHIYAKSLISHMHVARAWQAEEEQMTEDVELEEIDIPPEEDLYVNMDCLAHKVRGGASVLVHTAMQWCRVVPHGRPRLHGPGPFVDEQTSNF